MRIAFILDSIRPRSSIARIVLNLARVIKQKGHQIQIFTLDCDFQFIKWYGIKKDELKSYKKLFYLSRLSRIPLLGYIFQIFKFICLGIFLINNLSKTRPDIINSHYYLCGVSGYIVSRLISIPHVVTFHGIHLSKSNLNTLFYWTDYVVTDYLKNHLSYFISVDPCIRETERFEKIRNRIEIIHPCLDAQFIELADNFKQEYKPINGIKLIFLGRIEKQKGLESLLIELAKVESFWSNLSVTCSGKYENKLKKIAINLGLLHKIFFSGFLSEIDKIKLMNNSDIFISLSKSEGFPLAILESLYLGKLCFIYPISPFANEKGSLNKLGIKFKEERLGIFLKPGSKSLLKILNSSQISNLFSDDLCESRKKFVMNFYPEIIANRYLEYFTVVRKEYFTNAKKDKKSGIIQ